MGPAPFLQGVPEDVRAAVQPAIRECEFGAGALILQAGQFTDAAFVIGQGGVQMRFGAPQAPVRQIARPRARWGKKPASEPVESDPLLGRIDNAGSGTEVLDLGPGEIFGETSVLSRYPMAADVIALEPTRCWQIEARAMRTLIDVPECASFSQFFDARYRERALLSVLRRVGPFASVSNQALQALRDRVPLRAFKPGRVIVKQGTAVKGLLVIRGGYVKVSIDVDGAEQVITYLRPGDTAGELVRVVADEPWPFSLSAVEHVEVVEIPADSVDALCREFPEVANALASSAARRLKERGRARKHPEQSAVLERAMSVGLTHGSSVLLIDLSICTRCDDCVRACADTHQAVPRFVREGTRLGRFSVPSACFHCADPVCLIGCPTGAITRPHGTREVIVNQTTCIGCGNCATRCPWDNIHSAPFESPALGKQIDLAVKCDLCAGRADGPACVQMCPHGAAFRVNGKSPAELTRVLEAVR